MTETNIDCSSNTNNIDNSKNTNIINKSNENSEFSYLYSQISILNSQISILKEEFNKELKKRDELLKESENRINTFVQSFIDQGRDNDHFLLKEFDNLKYKIDNYNIRKEEQINNFIMKVNLVIAFYFDNFVQLCKKHNDKFVSNKLKPHKSWIRPHNSWKFNMEKHRFQHKDVSFGHHLVYSMNYMNKTDPKNNKILVEIINEEYNEIINKIEFI